MKVKIQILTLCTVLLLFSGTNELKAQNTFQDSTILKEFSNLLTNKYWLYMAKEEGQQDVLICGNLLEFKLDGQALWHPIYQKLSLKNLTELYSFIKQDSFRKSKYTYSDKYELFMSSAETDSNICHICFSGRKDTYTIEQLSDSVLILNLNDSGRMVFISVDKLNDKDFVIEKSNLIPKDTIGNKRIKGIWAVNSEGKSEKPIAKNDAIRKELWLQRLKDKGRWVYNPVTDRNNLPVSPTMYPNYQNQPRF